MSENAVFSCWSLDLCFNPACSSRFGVTIGPPSIKHVWEIPELNKGVSMEVSLRDPNSRMVYNGKSQKWMTWGYSSFRKPLYAGKRKSKELGVFHQVIFDWQRVTGWVANVGVEPLPALPRMWVKRYEISGMIFMHQLSAHTHIMDIYGLSIYFDHIKQNNLRIKASELKVPFSALLRAVIWWKNCSTGHWKTS